MRRIFLIHGWGGSPQGDWLPWANKVLTEVGYDVYVPEMPDTNHPKIDPWVNKLTKVVASPKSNDIFIGHSIGCQTILRYLEKLGEGQKVNKIILIAPWWYLTLGKDEDPKVAEPWLKSFVDFEKVKERANTYVCVFSDNDPFVPFKKNLEFFKENLNPDIVIKSGLGHFTADEGSTKIEFLIDIIN